MADIDTRPLFGKFHVRRVDGSDAPGGKHEDCDYYVLDVTHDKHAIPALVAYCADAEAERPTLVADLRAKYKLPATPARPPPGEPAVEKQGDEAQWRADFVDQYSEPKPPDSIDHQLWGSALRWYLAGRRAQAAIAPSQSQPGGPDRVKVLEDALVSIRRMVEHSQGNAAVEIQRIASQALAGDAP